MEFNCVDEGDSTMDQEWDRLVFHNFMRKDLQPRNEFQNHHLALFAQWKVGSKYRHV